MKARPWFKLQELPLQSVLIVPFVLQIFGAVGLVSYLSFKNSQKAVNDLANQLMTRTSSTVDQHLDAYLSIPHKVLQTNAAAIQMGLLNVQDRSTTAKYFWKQLQAYDLTYLGVGLTTGAGAGAGRYDGKTVVIDDWNGKPPHKLHSYATDQQGNRPKVSPLLTGTTSTKRGTPNPSKHGNLCGHAFTASIIPIILMLSPRQAVRFMIRKIGCSA
jgi:hypothetical protein